MNNPPAIIFTSPPLLPLVFMVLTSISPVAWRSTNPGAGLIANSLVSPAVLIFPVLILPVEDKVTAPPSPPTAVFIFPTVMFAEDCSTDVKFVPPTV